ncbi:MAG: DEAD/DEAH box helicase [Candidatus Caenarcaniphilales bacterium]|nr:DEAD/DEAH box helicase [Candidatus Caenarcaniphilales bacterium]
MSKFNEFKISANTLSALEQMGFDEATPIQAKAIPLLLEGEDIIGQAQTGTGKTVAFAIPAVENITPEIDDIQILVLCPTRELAIQVSDEFKKITQMHPDIETIAIYGGQNISIQLKALKRAKRQIIVGTPGRVMDHQRRGTIKLDYLNTVILDEADQMIDMGFYEDMKTILSETPEDRQTVMFSATMNKKLMSLMEDFQNNPKHVNVMDQKEQSKQIKQVYYQISPASKFEALKRLITFYNFESALIFCNTKIKVDELAEQLMNSKYTAAALHGDLDQKKRAQVMSAFRKGNIRFLIATDVAARGIDIDDLEAVVNYDFPRFGEDYVHRIGRTGRAGRGGLALSFIARKELENMKKTARMKKLRLEEAQVPSIKDLEKKNLRSLRDELAQIRVSEKDEKLLENFLVICEDMNLTEEQVFALMLKYIAQNKFKELDAGMVFEEQMGKYNKSKSHKQSNKHKKFPAKDGKNFKHSFSKKRRSNNSKKTSKFK